MSTLLYIPWFKLNAWEIPFPFIDVLPIQPFGVLVAIGILFGTRIAEWHGERNGVPRHVVADFLLYTILIGLISAMLLNMVMYDQDRLADNLLWIKSRFTGEPDNGFQYPGLSSYGGFMGGVAAAFWFRQRKNMSIMVLGDIWCFAFPFAWLFGRTGCFVVHDHPGEVTDFFLAVENYNLRGEPRHDLGLYEVIWSAAVIPLFLWLARSRRPRGFYMALLPILYAPIRFFLDYLREVPANGGDVRYMGLTPGQYASIAFTVVGVLVLQRVLKGGEYTLMLDGSTPPPYDDEGPSQSPTTATSGGGGSGTSKGAKKTKRAKGKKR